MPSKEVLEKKKAQVQALAKELQEAESIVFSDYKGLTVAEETAMRAEFRKHGLSYKVVKNSISERAVAELGLEGLNEVLSGPTAIAYSKEDVVLAPRLLREFCEEFKKMEIKGGVVNGEVASLDHIMQLSHVPSANALYGQLCFMLLYPLTSLAQVLGQIATKADEAGADQVSKLAVATEGVAAKAAEDSTESAVAKAAEDSAESTAAKVAEDSAESAAAKAAEVSTESAAAKAAEVSTESAVE